VKAEQDRLQLESNAPPALQYADTANISDEEKARRDEAFQLQA
jgi:hypothetical protein